VSVELANLIFSPLKQIAAVKHVANRYRRCWC